jgi:hypothetical protein
MDEAETMEMFGGPAGTPVPQVDPEDVGAVFVLGQNTQKRHPNGGVAIGIEIFERACKPGAIVKAVVYRANMIQMLQHAAPELMDPLLQDKLDAVLRIAAEIKMEWIGVGIVRHGLPFDAEDFVRRVREAA